MTASMLEKRARVRQWALTLGTWSGDITILDADRAQLAWDLLLVLAGNTESPENEQSH